MTEHIVCEAMAARQGEEERIDEEVICTEAMAEREVEKISDNEEVPFLERSMEEEDGLDPDDEESIDVLSQSSSNNFYDDESEYDEDINCLGGEEEAIDGLASDEDSGDSDSGIEDEITWYDDFDNESSSDDDDDTNVQEITANDNNSERAAGDKAASTAQWEVDKLKFCDAPCEYPGLFDGTPSGPTAAILSKAQSPIEMLFYFMPKRLWQKIAKESNRYHQQTLKDRVQKIYRKQREKDTQQKEKKREIARRLRRMDPIQAHEILKVLGLMIAHTICPQKRRFSHHWSQLDDGALPRGTFGKFLPRNRYERPIYEICQLVQ
jgi:hypothetical protein